MSDRTKKLAILAGVGVALLGGSFGGGYAVGVQKVSAAEAALAAAEDAARTEKASLESRIAEGERRITALTREKTRLEARRLLDIALRDVDQRNFGIAQGHLDEAAEKLGASTGDDPEVTELARALDDTQITVAEDFEPQRQGLLDLLRRLDAELE